MLVRAVERLIPLGSLFPAHADRHDVRISVALQRREIKLQTLFITLLVLEPPAGDWRQGSQAKKTFLVLQMVIATKNLGPFAVGVFHYYDARHDCSRQIVCGRFGQHVGSEKLLLPIFCEISEGQHLRLTPQDGLGRHLNLFGDSRLSRLRCGLRRGLRSVRSASTQNHSQRQDWCAKLQRDSPCSHRAATEGPFFERRSTACRVSTRTVAL